MPSDPTAPDSLAPRLSGNPVFPGWYADPELHLFTGPDGVPRYYIYPTGSADFARQASFECWSSEDLTHW
ncbi:MAG: arabinan endo,5-alpha-L-arabinosidase, partial [Deinococcus sp.]|nr:arabinan endo,5-alpha-L-arabinosidase [Deinococcus sp.]